MDIRRSAFVLSAVVLLLSVFSIAYNGVRMGLEFTGEFKWR